MLDIAGGSGSLSFCLQTVHGVRCTTVDPRPAKLSKDAHRHLARLRAQAGSAAGTGGESLLDSEPDFAHDSVWGCLEQDDHASSAAATSTSKELSGLLAEPNSTWYIVVIPLLCPEVHVNGSSYAEG